MRSSAVFKIQEIKRPVSGEIIGYRGKLAHYNMDGHIFGVPAPSFAKAYLIAESGDYTSDSDPRILRWAAQECERLHLEIIG